MNDSTTAAPALVAGQVTEILRREARIAEGARIAREALAQDTDALICLIRDGKATTGDRITDYFIAAHGILDDAEVSKPLREIQGRMSGKAGELFLVALHESKRHVFGGPSYHRSSRDYHTETRYFLGVLDGDSLFLNPEALLYGLPTQKYVELSSDMEFIEHEGPFILSGVMSRLGFGIEPNVVGTEVFVGDVEVLNY